MARRSTAPSLWLPGFDPDDPEPPTLPEPAIPIVVPAAEPVPAACIETAVEALPEQVLVVARTNWRTTSHVVEALPRVFWPRLTSTGQIHPVGPAAKFEANLAAIDRLLQLEAENRAPGVEERQALLRYTGWGGLPASFNLDADDLAWAARARQLQDALPAEDYESARASVNDSHYTEIHVIEAMWQAIRGFGFTGGRILKPAAGVGHFIGAMPEDLAERSSVTAIEIDRISGRILRALYASAGVDARISPFEKAPLPENWFDLVIGNVPFGKYKVADQSNRAYAHFSIHNYFLTRSLDLVRPDGLVCLITSSHTMESRQEAVRQYLASQAHLLGAIRLPKGAFAGIAATEVQTDILFLRKRQRSETVEAEWLDITAVTDELRHPHRHHRPLRHHRAGSDGGPYRSRAQGAPDHSCRGRWDVHRRWSQTRPANHDGLQTAIWCLKDALSKASSPLKAEGAVAEQTRHTPTLHHQRTERYHTTEGVWCPSIPKVARGHKATEKCSPNRSPRGLESKKASPKTGLTA